MRDSRIHYILVGSFVLAMLTALVLSVAFISGRTGATDPYYVSYDNVAGVRYGTKVFFQGYPVGQVDEIVPQAADGRMRFRLKLDIKRGWPIPDDSLARVAASGLLAAMAIDIKGGTSQTVLKPGDEIRSLTGGNLMSVVTDVAAEVTNLSQNSLKPLLETLNQMAQAFGPLLQARAPQILDNLVALSTDLATKTPKISANVEQMTTGMNRLLSPDNTRKMEAMIGHADRTAANMAELTGTLQSSKAKLDSLLATLDGLALDNRDNVTQSLRDLRYTLQSVSQNIDGVTENLEGTARNMNEFSREVRSDPSLILRGRRAEEGK